MGYEASCRESGDSDYDLFAVLGDALVGLSQHLATPAEGPSAGAFADTGYAVSDARDCTLLLAGRVAARDGHERVTRARQLEAWSASLDVRRHAALLQSVDSLTELNRLSQNW